MALLLDIIDQFSRLIYNKTTVFSSPPRLWVQLERFVGVSVEETDFGLILKVQFCQCFGIVVEYPVIMIEIDDEICSLCAMGLHVQFYSV